MLLRSVLFAGIFACAGAFAAANPDLAHVRSMGVEVERALSEAQHGQMPTAVQLARLEQQLAALSQPDQDVAVARKLQAIGIAFDQLRNAAVNNAPGAAPISFTEEIVTRAHGSACANAIGLPVDLPVRIELGTGADAWFYANPNAGTGLRFVTRSNGPDPAIEAFSGCSKNARRIAQNDDNVGLDASLAVDAGAADLVLLHVSNAGEPGKIDLLATATVGTIIGTIRDAKTSQPIVNAYVAGYTAVSSYFEFVGNTFTDSNGNYVLTPGQTGAVYVVASAPSRLTQLYPSGYCPYGSYNQAIGSCDLAHAQTVNVTATSNTKNINFALTTGARLSGQVRDTAKSPLQTNVYLMNASGTPLANAFTDSAGHFEFLTVPPGSYFLEATTSGYSSQLYNHVDCGGALHQNCDFATGNVLTVGSTDILDIDFTLQRLSSFTGVMTSDGNAVTSYSATVFVVDSSGNGVATSSVDGSGRYVTGSVPPGTYYLYAVGNGIYPQLYGGHDCVTSCVSELPSGVPLTVSSNGQQIEADFHLDALPSLTGHVTDSVSGLPLSNVTVLLSTSPNSIAYPYFSGVSDASGNYVVPVIQPGTYYAWAQSPDHVDQIYDGIVCEQPSTYGTTHCDVSGATLIDVTAGKTSLPKTDFALAPSASISGTALMRAGPGSDLPAYDAYVQLYDNTGTQLVSVVVDFLGHYTINDLAPGSYYLLAGSLGFANQYLAQMWQGEDCSSCVPTSSTPIVVTQGQALSGIDFQLTRVDAVVGRVTDTAGVPIAGAVVDLFKTMDKSYVTGTGTDEQGYYFVPSDVGSSYYLATEVGGGYVDQVYSGIACPAGTAYDGRCSLNGATAVALPANATQPHVVNFMLQVADRLFSNGFE